jgi:hypothetical protein
MRSIDHTVVMNFGNLVGELWEHVRAAPAHFYQQPGREDQVLAAEYDLLTTHGHAVKQYSADNDSLHGISGLRMAGRAL